MFAYIQGNLPVVVLGIAALAAIFYLWRELRRTREELATAAAGAGEPEKPPPKRVSFQDDPKKRDRVPVPPAPVPAPPPTAAPAAKPAGALESAQ